MQQYEKFKGLYKLGIVLLIYCFIYYSLGSKMSKQLYTTATAFEHFLQGIFAYSVVKKLHNKMLTIIVGYVFLICLFNYLCELWALDNSVRVELSFNIIGLIIVYIKDARYINANISRSFKDNKEK